MGNSVVIEVKKTFRNPYDWIVLSTSPHSSKVQENKTKKIGERSHIEYTYLEK